jgi:hypothetical protein
MRGARASVATAVAALLAAVWACRAVPQGPGERAASPRPVLELAAQSYARRVADWPYLPPGPGAEGQPGDFLLENELVRFVVGAADRGGPIELRGHLLDAAVQGGEDRMRLLAPLLGSSPGRTPRCSAVGVTSVGGLETEAVVAAEGSLPGTPDVHVTTTYTLAPASSFLEVRTSVENRGESIVPLLTMGDVLYHGRTLRYAPGAGLMPAGRGSSCRWLVFFHGDRAWGVLRRGLGRIQADFRIGSSRLLYSTVDIPPGESRSYVRSVMAAVGGPEAVWLAARPVHERTLSRLSVAVRDRGTSRPVPNAQVTLAPQRDLEPVVLLTGPTGEAELALPAGGYTVAVSAPGRPGVGPFRAECAASQAHRLGVQVEPLAEARISVSARVGDYVAPSPARLTCYAGRRADRPTPEVPPFPVDWPSGVTFIGTGGQGRAPLATRAAGLPGGTLLVASRGPLFECAAMPLSAEPGQVVETPLLLSRACDPGDYVAVDVRQHTRLSLDCALTAAERALAGASEGLDAAVVSDPAFRLVIPGLSHGAACSLLPGYRLELPAAGSLSIYPLHGPTASEPADLAAMTDPSRPAAAVLADLRRALPEAVIQLNAPLDAEQGCFALSGFDPTRGLGRAPEFEFDAIEILSGDDVASARRLLPYWFHLLRAGRRTFVTGGSGSRDLGSEMPGMARTFVHCPGAAAGPSPERVAAAILALRTAPNAFVTNGPFVEATLDGAPIGSLTEAEGPEGRLRLCVRAPRWVDVSRATVYRNGEPVHEIELAPTGSAQRCDRVLEVETGADCWVVVVVEGDRPMRPVYPGGRRAPRPFAVTNPFWVDADGDGRVLVGE